jgi:hypothetical protein
MALDGAATNAADLFRSAIASPKERPKRRTSMLAGVLGGGSSRKVEESGPLDVSERACRPGGRGHTLSQPPIPPPPSSAPQMDVRLLDDSLLHATVTKGATVKDVLVTLRRQLGLRADADYSLYLRQTQPDGTHVFAALPDVMAADQADALACEWRGLAWHGVGVGCECVTRNSGSHPSAHECMRVCAARLARTIARHIRVCVCVCG